MMELYNRILMKRSFILLWCINCLEHIHLHTPCYHTSSNTCTTPRYWTHIHTFQPPTPPPHPKPGMCKHGPHLASTTFLCYPPPPKKRGEQRWVFTCIFYVLKKKTKNVWIELFWPYIVISMTLFSCTMRASFVARNHWVRSGWETGWLCH